MLLVGQGSMMDGFSLVDIYSTKGAEYLISVVAFICFLALQRFILKPPADK